MPSAIQILYRVPGPLFQIDHQILRSPESVTALQNVDINMKYFTLRSEDTQLKISGRDINIKRLRDYLVDLSTVTQSTSLKWI